jgi:hypothetical protein
MYWKRANWCKVQDDWNNFVGIQIKVGIFFVDKLQTLDFVGIQIKKCVFINFYLLSNKIVWKQII